MKTKLISTALVISTSFVASAVAQFSVTDTSANIINFNSFTGTGFAPTPSAGQLDSDTWSIAGFDNNVVFGGTGASGDPARGTSTGGTNSGGVYAFEVAASDFALGVQPGTSDFTPGDFTFALTNNTGSTVTSFTVSYDVYIYNDQSRSNSLGFGYSTDDSTYTSVGSASVTSAEAADVSPAWVSSNQSFTISGITLTNGSNFFFQWTGNDVGGGGSRDEFAIDNLTFSAVVPEPSAYAMLAGLSALGFVMLRRRGA